MDEVIQEIAIEPEVDEVVIDDATGEIKPDEKPDAKPDTKRVSDRVNKVKAKYEAELNSYKEKSAAETKALKERLMKYEAEERGISIEDLRDEQQKKDNEIREAVKNDPEYQRLERAEFERQKADALSALQKEFPDDNITDIDNFPPDFYAMLSVGVDPTAAYRASVAVNKKTAPPTAGSMKSDAVDTGGYFTEEQVRAMSTEEVNKNYDAVIRSMKTWK